jgi:hypothetical protein
MWISRGRSESIIFRIYFIKFIWSISHVSLLPISFSFSPFYSYFCPNKEWVSSKDSFVRMIINKKNESLPKMLSWMLVNLLLILFFIFLHDGGILLTTYLIVREDYKLIRGNSNNYDDEEEETMWNYVILDDGHLIENKETQEVQSLFPLCPSHCHNRKTDTGTG